MTEIAKQPFAKVPVTAREFREHWVALQQVKVADFLQDQKRQRRAYKAFSRHETLARRVAEPPVLVFKAPIQNEDPHLAVRKESRQDEDILLAARSWLPQERIIARFHLADDDGTIYFLTPPIGVTSLRAKPTEIGVARVCIGGGFREVYDPAKGEWQKKTEGGLYVRQNTRNAWQALRSAQFSEPRQ